MRGRMRALERNKSTFYYALRDRETAEEDSFGNQSIEYLPLVRKRAHISPASGTTAIEQFGYNIRYDKVIVTTDMDCPIDENTVLIIDSAGDLANLEDVSDDTWEMYANDPLSRLELARHYREEEDGSLTLLYDYVVKRVSKSLNNISYAVEKVEVS